MQVLPKKPKDKLSKMGTRDPVAEAKMFDTRQQPAFHAENKTLMEKIGCCCVVDRDLTRVEVSAAVFHLSLSVYRRIRSTNSSFGSVSSSTMTPTHGMS